MNMHAMRLWVSMLFAVVGVPLAAQDLRLHGLFGSHMVLPQQATVVVPGRAVPGAAVAIAAPWLDAPVRSKAAEDGRFAVPLPTPAAGGPFRIEVRCGDARVALDDVLVGDVWLGSGQSNMEMSVAPGPIANGVQAWAAELDAIDAPPVRLFTVRRRVAARPADDLVGMGEWQVCSKASVAPFSATAWFFGRALQAERKQPLGLVVSSWGGTVCEAWTRAEGLAGLPEFRPALDQLAADAAGGRQRARAKFWDAVAARDPRVGGQRAEATAFDDSAWAEAQLPAPWSAGPAAARDGVAWYRRTVTIPTAWAGQALALQLGPIDDMDTVWFAGRRVGGREEPGHWNEPRNYVVPGELVVAGPAVLAVRVLDTGGEGGFTGSAEAMRLSLAAGEGGAIDLSGVWRTADGAGLGELPPMPASGDDPNLPSVLWNGMIAPLVPFPFRGVVWYQGESNRTRAEQYGRLFPAMIRDWRAAFGRELPFLFVQIAPFAYPNDTGELFALRLQQEQALLLPATGMAATTDIGEVRDIHPARKREVGERLARLALRLVHGRENVAALPPRPTQARRQGADLVLGFGGAAGELRTTRDGPHHFEVAGADGVYHPAMAMVAGTVVTLHSERVPAPERARYCFAATALGDLWDAAGLPVVPFEIAAEN